MNQLEIKVLNIIDARCNHEVYHEVYSYVHVFGKYKTFLRL